MTRLVVDICDELWQRMLLHLEGDRQAIAAFVREVLEAYLEAFNATP